jgi:hypothetical protein
MSIFLLFDYQRRSKRLRIHTATPFMMTRNPSRTRMAADVRETNPRSGLSAQM